MQKYKTMFRFHVEIERTLQIDFPRDSSGDSQTTCVTVGNTILLRQSNFKFEKLVPVFSTRYVLVVLPVHFTDCDEKSVGEPQFFEQFLSQIQHLKKFLLEVLPPSTPLHVTTIACDPVRRHSFVVFDVVRATSAVHLLEAVDEKIPPYFFPSHGSPSAAVAKEFFSPRRAVAFPCDPRPLADVGGWEEIQNSYYLLPSCMICCDRLDRTISGIASNICDCPSDCCSCVTDSSCPACVASLAREHPCTECASVDDSWVCLICGYVGCSRYRESHVRTHCQAEGHFFSLSLTTQQIWDYLSDRFVHRMLVLLDHATGKSERMEIPEGEHPLVEGGGSHAKGKETTAKVLVDAKLDAKIENCCQEYTQMLTKSLAAQRNHYSHFLARSGLNATVLSDSLLLHEATSSLNDYFDSLALDVKMARDAVRDANHALLRRQAIEKRVEQLQSKSSEVEEAQRQLKETYRKILEDEAAYSSNVTNRITELRESIEEVKLNMATSKKLSSRLGSGDRMSGPLALSGAPTASVQTRKSGRKS